MTTTIILSFGIFVALFTGAALSYVLARRRAARELARLWELVPEARLLRHAAEYAGLAAFRDSPGFDSPGEDSVALRNLAARIDAANDDAAEIASQCTSCLCYILPPSGWHCAKHRLAPTEKCEDHWEGMGKIE